MLSDGEMIMTEKVNLDRVAAQVVHQVATRENRSASNAASTVIREAWAARMARDNVREQRA
jgi:hypothetical protein